MGSNSFLTIQEEENLMTFIKNRNDSLLRFKYDDRRDHDILYFEIRFIKSKKYMKNIKNQIINKINKTYQFNGFFISQQKNFHYSK